MVFGDLDTRLGGGKNGFILGYPSLFLTDIEGFPLGQVEAPANVNETLLVEPLLDRLLGENLELKLLARDIGFDSGRVFDALDDYGLDNLLAWRRPKGKENPPDALTVKDRLDVEGPKHKRVVYMLLNTIVEGFIGRFRFRLAYGRLTL